MPQRRLKRTGGEGGEEGVKVKARRTAPTNTSLLPPCKVCQEPAAGFHYGANTCEACKGFFRRTLVRDGDYECLTGREQCSVVQIGKVGKKRICPRCRHLKCLAVGMSPGAIKTGRYTHAKRTQDILEYRQVMGLSPEVSSPSPAPSASTPTPVAASPLPSSVSDRTPLSSVSPQPSVLGLQTPSPANSGMSSPAPSSCPVKSRPSNEAGPQYTTLTPAAHYTNLTSAVRTSGLSASANPCPADFFTPCEQRHYHGDGPSGLSPLNCGAVASPISVFSFVGNSLDQAVGGETVRSDDAISLSSSVVTPLSAAPPSPEAVVSSSERSSDWMSEEECRQLTSHLLQSHKRVEVNKLAFTPEELLQRQQACYENCKARIEAFGPMGQVSEEEYQEVYRTTGIDVDDRQAFVTILSKMLDENIRQHIGFVKTIPGFSQLTLKDQIRLIKDNRCEIGALYQTVGFNHRLKVLTLPSGSCFCEHDLEKLGGPERTRCRINCLRAIQCLGLTEEERILFKCVVLFTSGHDDLDEPEKVSAIQWRMAQCLLWQLRQSRPNPDSFFARIISVFLRMKDLAKTFYEWMKSKPFEHYVQFKNNKLLAEWFSHS